MKQKLKICIITRSLNGGGAEKVAVNLANHYSAIYEEVFLIAIDGSGPYRQQLSTEIKFIDLRCKNLRSCVLKSINCLNEISPEIILSTIRNTNILTGLSKLCRGYRFKHRLIMCEASTMDGEIKKSIIKKNINIALMRISYGQAEKIVANSKTTKEDLLKLKISNQEKIHVIGNPVLSNNVHELAAQPANHEWFNDKKLKVILSVGRLIKLKDHATLVRSFALAQKNIPCLRLVIIGEGEQEENLIRISKSLYVNKYFLILPFQKNIYPYYRCSDLFILTSEYEGFGNVLVEAMACGTPIISTNCRGGPPEILKYGKLAPLIPVGDHKSLAESILNHFKNPSENNIASLLINEASNYSIDTIAQKYLS